MVERLGVVLWIASVLFALLVLGLGGLAWRHSGWDTLMATFFGGTAAVSLLLGRACLYVLAGR